METPRYQISDEPIVSSKRVGSTRDTTAQSTSRTTNVSTAFQSDTMFVVALVENRVREVGLCAIDLKNPELLLSQYPDTQTFLHTCTKLSIYDPVEIIIPHTALESELAKLIEAKFTNSRFSTVQRKYFSESKGILYLKNLVIPELGKAVELECESKYLCLAATAALIKYVEFIQAFNFVAGTLKMTFSSSDKCMVIDSESIRNLELVANLRTGKATQSLYSILDQCKTAMGTRLLRSNIVQPLSDIKTICGRLDLVEEFTNQERMLIQVKDILPLLDLDKLIFQTQLVQIPKKSGTKSSQMLLKNIIKLKQVLEVVPKLAEYIQSNPNELLKAIHTNLTNTSLTHIHNEIDRVINQDTIFSKSAYQMRTQQCFAVKPGINGLLDVARKTYTETIEDIHELVKSLKDDYGLTSLKLQYSTKRGHFLTVDAKTDGSFKLPEVFIQVSKQGKKLQCSTEALIRLNQRNNDSLNEILLMTERVLDTLIHEIRKYIGSIYKLSDSIAFLDLITNFATYALSGVTSKPEFTEDGPIVIKQGRHPMLDKIQHESLIPNDTFMSQACSFQIITGPNMSGKSTYIRQVALLSILSHIGCYVPAQYASFRLVDRLFTRIGTSDQIETNSSSFMKEMVEMSYILLNATDKSLVIIDELGRGTSSRDGIALSWSICEHILTKKVAYVLFVTHFVELTELENLYPNVKNYHLMIDTQSNQLKFMFQVTEGSIRENSYGIRMAERAGLDPRVIELARQIAANFHTKRNQRTTNTHNYFQLAQRLLSLKHSTLDEEGIRSYLKTLKLVV